MRTNICAALFALFAAGAVHAQIGFDCLVNDTTSDSLGGASQCQQDIAYSPSGTVVLVWNDNRRAHEDIYMRLYDTATGQPLGPSLVVNDDWGTSGQSFPSVAMRNDGGFVVVWMDTRNGHADIWGQKFLADGSRDGFNFLVNDDGGNAEQWNPDISMDSLGNCCVVWADGRTGEWEVWGQRFDAGWQPVGANLRTSGSYPVGITDAWVEVALSNCGSFVVAWETQRSNDYRAMAAIFDFSTGSVIKEAFRVNTTPGGIWPCVSTDNLGNFVVIYRDWGYAPSDGYLWGQRFNALGDPMTATFPVSNTGMNPCCVRPGMAMRGSDGKFAVGWIYGDPTLSTVLRYFDENGNGTAIDTAAFGTSHWSRVRVAGRETAEGAVAWIDVRNGNLDLYVQGMDSLRNLVGPNILVNDDGDYMSNALPEIGFIRMTSRVLVGYADMRKSMWRGYGRLFHVQGDTLEPLGPDFELTGDPDEHQLEDVPSLAGSDAGRFAGVWRWMGSDNLPRMRFRLWDSDGAVMATGDIEYDGDTQPWEPVVAMDSSGNSIVVFRKSYTGEYRNAEIRGLRFDPSGTQIGDDFRIDQGDSNFVERHYPHVAMNPAGQFAAVWNDWRNGRADIHGRLFSWAGATPLSDEFRIHADTSQTGYYIPRVAMDDSLRAVVVWNDRRNGNWDVYGRRFEWNGVSVVALDSTDCLMSDGATAEQKGARVAMASSKRGDFVVAWHDWRSGSQADIRVRYFDRDGLPWGASFVINSDLPPMQLVPCLTANDSTVVAAWMDDRNGNWDIYARANMWEEPVGAEEERVECDRTGVYFRAFFNGKAVDVHLVLPKAESVTVCLYDVAGRVVRRTGLGRLSRGHHAVRIADMRSGVYFVQVNAGNKTATQKVFMVR